MTQLLLPTRWVTVTLNGSPSCSLLAAMWPDNFKVSFEYSSPRMMRLSSVQDATCVEYPGMVCINCSMVCAISSRVTPRLGLNQILTAVRESCVTHAFSASCLKCGVQDTLIFWVLRAIVTCLVWDLSVGVSCTKIWTENEQSSDYTSFYGMSVKPLVNV